MQRMFLPAPMFPLWTTAHYYQVQATLKIYSGAKPNTVQHSPTPGALPTPVKVNSLLFFLQGYPIHLNESLQKGFTEGFQLHFQGPVTGHFSGNLVSAINNPEIVDNKLAKEIHAGRIIGPFDQPPLDNLRVSPLGVIPKKQPGEFRMIHHLSFPQGGSVNDFIPQEFEFVRLIMPQLIMQFKLLGV